MRYIFQAFWVLALASSAANAQITPQQASSLMQKGINLGNTLEPPLEGGWNNPWRRNTILICIKRQGLILSGFR